MPYKQNCPFQIIEEQDRFNFSQAKKDKFELLEWFGNIFELVNKCRGYFYAKSTTKVKLTYIQ